MITTWSQMRAFILSWESMAVTDIPGDRGGQTAGGISRRYHPFARVWQLVDRGITSGPEYEAAVHEFYDQKYKALFEQLPPRLNAAVVDAMVNMGPGRDGDNALGAIELLQLALCRVADNDYVEIDGDLGPQTTAAVRACDPSAVAFALCALRLAEYGRRGRKGDARRAFLDGWINRVRDLMGRM